MKVPKQTKAARFVKIDPSRGYGEGVWEVLSEQRDQYQLKAVSDGKRITIYKAHCYTDQDTIKATVSDRQAKLQAAMRIGRKS